MKKKSILSIAVLTLCTLSSFAPEAKKKAETPPTETTKKAATAQLMGAGEYSIVGTVIDHPMQLAIMNEQHGKWLITPAQGILGILKTTGLKKCHALVTIDADKTSVISFHSPSDKKALASYPEKHAVKIKATGTTADAATATKSKPKKTGV